MAHIILSNGMKCTVDDDDFNHLSKYRWHLLKTKKPNATIFKYYAYRATRIDRKQVNILMHREILNAPKGVPVDHENGDGLDNRRANIRLASDQSNSFNALGRAGKTSIYKGVSWHKAMGRWRAVSGLGGKHIHIFGSHSEIECAQKYDEFARANFGEFACLNFPDDGARSAIRRWTP